MKKSKTLIILFFSMLKIGLFTFGGGYAMIALLSREFVDKKQWISKDDFMNMVIIAESTPGPIAINSATYIGYKTGKLIGSIIATIAVCIPSFIIIYIISLFFDRFLQNNIINSAFKGIQVGVVLLILSAGIKMLKQLERKPMNYIILFSSIIIMVTLNLFATNFPSILLILISGIIGASVYLIKKIKKKEKVEK